MKDEGEPMQQGGSDAFSHEVVRAGARTTIPLELAGFVYGLLFGVLAASKGLSLLETAAMSGFVFAGTAQLVAFEMWRDHLPVVAIVLTTALINARLALMGVSLCLRDSFVGLSKVKTYVSLFLLTDESWALTMGRHRRGPSNAAFLLGSGVVLHLSWLSSTTIGHVTGAWVSDPARFGLDFAFTAVFVALIAGFWQGPRDLPPWLAAAAAAIAGSWVLPANTHILLGSAAGIAVAALHHED